jgi:hypothetical protein
LERGLIYEWRRADYSCKNDSVCNGDSSVKLTNLEKEMAFSMLKRNADRRIDWTEQQKEQYKELVDICKRSCDNNS